MLSPKPEGRFVFTYNLVAIQGMVDRLSKIISRTEMGVFNGYMKQWVEGGRNITDITAVDENIYRNIILSSLHPDFEFAICAIPVNSTTDEEWLLNDFLQFSLDLAGGSRKHGHFVFSRFGSKPGTVGQYYFPENKRSMGRINYGSISLSENKSLFQLKNARILVLPDPELVNLRPGPNYTNPWKLGDAHGKINADLLDKLLEGVVSEEGDRRITPTQFRLGIAGNAETQGIWGKGTVMPIADSGGYDLILPESCFKTYKPAPGENNFEVVSLACLGEAQERKAQGGTQIWAWFPVEIIEQDIMPATLRECDRMMKAIMTKNIYEIARLFNREEQLKNEPNHEDIDVLPPAAQRWFDRLAESYAEGDPDDDADDDSDPHVPMLTLILQNDIAKLLENHPYVIDSLKRSLKKKWTRLAINGAIKFRSYMAMPDDSLPDLTFSCKHLKPGQYITFRYPVRHWGDIQLWDCMNAATNDEYNGVFFTSHVTFGGTGELNESPFGQGGDFDGDYGNMGLASKFPNITQRIKDWADPSSPHYRPRPKLVKQPKSPIGDTLKQVALRSMDNQTGLVASQIMHAQAKGLGDVIIPDGSGRTVLEVLSQALQDEVDRFKNDLQRDTKAMVLVSKILATGSKKPVWQSDYKSKEAYLDRPMNVGAEGVDDDTISWMIRQVNNYWEQAEFPKPKTLGQFRSLFGANPILNGLVTQQQLDFARQGQKDYNRRLKLAVQSADVDEKALSKLMDDLRLQRQTLESELKKRYSAIEASAKLWSWAIAYWWVAHNENAADMPGHPMGKAGLPFLLFPDIIAEQLLQARADFPIYGLGSQEIPNIVDYLPITELKPVVLLGVEDLIERNQWVLWPDEKGRLVYVDKAGNLALKAKIDASGSAIFVDNDYVIHVSETEDEIYIDNTGKVVLDRPLQEDETFYLTPGEILVKTERPHPRKRQKKEKNPGLKIQMWDNEWVNVGVTEVNNSTSIQIGQVLACQIISHKLQSGAFSTKTLNAQSIGLKTKDYLIKPNQTLGQQTWDEDVELMSELSELDEELIISVRSPRTNNQWQEIGKLVKGCAAVPPKIAFRVHVRNSTRLKSLIFYFLN